MVQNSAPAVPVILFPGAGKTTYNPQPYVGLNIAAEPDGQAMTLLVSVDDGVAVSAGNVSAGGVKLRMPTLEAGAHTLRFWLKDSQGAESPKASVAMMAASNSYARTIAAGSFIVPDGESHAAEITELLSRVNALRSWYGLAAIALPYGGATGNNSIKHFHTWMPNMQALYQGVADTGAISGASVPARVVRERNAPSAGVLNQIRSIVGSL